MSWSFVSTSSCFISGTSNSSVEKCISGEEVRRAGR